MKILLVILSLLACAGSAFTQSLVYRPTAYTAPFVATITDAASARTYLGVVAGLTNTGTVMTNATIYGLTINTGSTNNALTASRAVVTDANKGVVSSSVTGTELGYVSGVTSGIQGQFTTLNNTLATNTALLNGTNTFTGTNSFGSTAIIANGASVTNLAAGNLASGTVADARLSGNVPLLNANQTWTGTPTFPSSVFQSNSIAFRTLFTLTTNLYLTGVATNASLTTVTNNGCYNNLTPIVKVTLPPLLSSNSSIYVYYSVDATNSIAGTIGNAFYVGSNTNFVAGSVSFLNSGAVGRGFANGTSLLGNNASYTNQWQGGFTGLASIVAPSNFCDTSSSFTLYWGAYTTGNSPQHTIRSFQLIERVGN